MAMKLPDEEKLLRIRECYHAEGNHHLHVRVEGLMQGEAAKSLSRLHSVAELAGLSYSGLLTAVVGLGVKFLEEASGFRQTPPEEKGLKSILQGISETVATIKGYDHAVVPYLALYHHLVSIKVNNLILHEVNTGGESCDELYKYPHEELCEDPDDDPCDWLYDYPHEELCEDPDDDPCWEDQGPDKFPFG